MKSSEVISVWVVENTPAVQKNLVKIINKQADMECTMAFSTLNNAVSALKDGDIPDVMIYDFGCKELEGLNHVVRMKSRYPEIQIIVMSNNDETDTLYDSLCSGATGFLLKSSPEKIIVRSIRDVMAGGCPMNSSIVRKAIEVFTKLHSVSKQYGLSEREKEILRHIAQGGGNKLIAAVFSLSHHTVNAHLRNIYEKLQVHSRTEAAAKAIKERIV